MSNIQRRILTLENARDRDRGDGGTIYYVAFPRGMSQEEGLAHLGINLGLHDRVARSTDSSPAPELIGQAPVYMPPGALAEILAEIADEEGAHHEQH